jgi:alpha-glucoside transport system substrate-binding protein
MPNVVQAGAFWPESTSWVVGSQSLDDALRKIDASWP